MIYDTLSISENSDGPASLSVFIHENSDEIAVHERPIILICPGGGYKFVSDREADPVALVLAGMGYHTGIVRYSVTPARYPVALRELARAVKLVRSQSSPWHIDCNNVYLLGFSAGGHLVGEYCANWKTSMFSDICPANELQPNGMILGYPVITSGPFSHRDSFINLLGDSYDTDKDFHSIEKLINSNFPRSFIWGTCSDNNVSVQNSLLLVEELVRKKIPTEYHMFESGIHGLSLGNSVTQSVKNNSIEPSVQIWTELLKTWLPKIKNQ